MLFSSKQHARIAEKLRRKAANPKLAPLQRREILESAERFEALSVQARLIELRKEVSCRNSLYGLVEEASKVAARTKPEMQAALAAWHAGAREDGASEEYLQAYRELRIMLDKSGTIREFLIAARRWRDFPGHESKDR